MARRDLLVVGGITLAGALLRFTTLGTQSFWYDEGLTVQHVNSNFGGMLELDGETNPPLYYVLAWLWAHPFGSGEVALRSLSALAGTALIPVAYAVASRIGGFRVGWVTAAVLATNPLLIWYSQEARSYALFALFGALSFLCFLLWLERHDGPSLIGWAVSSALALATHYFAVFLIAPELLWMLVQARRRGQVLQAALASAAVVAVGLALLPLALHQRDVVGAEWIAEGTAGGLAVRLARIPGEFLTGHHPPHHLLLTVVAAGLAFGSAALLLRLRSRPARDAAAIPFALGSLVILVPTALAVVGLDYMITRNVIVAMLPLAIVMALGVTAPGIGRWAIALPAGLCLLGVVAVISIASDVRYQRDDWRAAAGALEELPAGGPRAVLASADTGAAALLAYLPAARALKGPSRVSEVDLLLLARRESRQPLHPPTPPPRPLPVPGFRLLERVRGETFTIDRYKASPSRPVSPAALEVKSLTGEQGSALLMP
jgi:4-amino-4-deoxy-L-arabinose transferase-like glycosyltransferase